MRPTSSAHKYRAAVLLLLVLAILGFAMLPITSSAGQTDGGESAEAAGPAVELPGKRTATSYTYRLGTGELETLAYDEPVNYRDEKGDWQPIEEELEPQADGS